MKNLPYKSIDKQVLFQWLDVANYAALRISKLGYDNDSQQLGFAPDFFFNPSSICMTYH